MSDEAVMSGSVYGVAQSYNIRTAAWSQTTLHIFALVTMNDLIPFNWIALWLW